MAKQKQKLVPLLRESAECISEGQYEKGLELAISASKINPKSEEAVVAIAVCYSRLGQADQADEFYKKAIELGPRNEHAHFGYAVHLMGLKEFRCALDQVMEAIAISPKRQENKTLREKILNADPSLRKSHPAGKSATVFEALSEGEVSEHTLPWIKKLEPAWTYFGWILAAASAIAFILLVSQHGTAIITAIRSGSSKPVVRQRASFDSVTGFLGNGAMVGGDIFFIVDVVDRRKSPLWLVPGVIFSCVGLGWVILPLYLFVGRRAIKQ